MSDPPAPSRLAWLAFGLVVIPAFIRAMTAVEPMPYWDTDAFAGTVPSTGRTPMLDLMLDLASLLGLVAACVAAWRSPSSEPNASPHSLPIGVQAGVPVGFPGGILIAVCFLLGVGGVLLHAGNEADRLLGISWIAAVSTGIGACMLARSAVMRRLMIAAVLGFVAMLLTKTGVQVLIDHPMTVESYEASREAILASRGWDAGSPAALQFERRLMQNDASAWFGLSNVLGGVASCIAAVSFTLSALLIRARESKRAAFPIAATLAAVLIVVLTNSKGAIATTGLGIGVGMVGVLFAQRPRVRPMLACAGVLACVVPIAAVVVRGMVGDASDELSLLFRSQYLQGTASILRDHAITGVGPSGFQDAYLLHKPPTSPEDVASPHNLPAAWLATLGLAGLGWVMLVVLALVRIGFATRQATPAPVDQSPTANEQPLARPMLLAIVAVACAPTFIAAMVEVEATTIEAALARVLGLVGWVSVAWGTTRAVTTLGAPMVRIAGLAGASALAAHLMLDVSGVFVSSASLVFLVVGALVPGSANACRTRQRVSACLGGAGGLAGLLLIAVSIAGINRWQTALRDAAEIARPVAEALIDVEQNPRDWSPRQRRALLSAELAALPESIAALRVAAEARPMHLPTRQALDRVLIRGADRILSVDPTREGDARAMYAEAAEGSEAFATEHPTATAWAWAATVRDRLDRAFPEAEVTGVVPAFLERAAELDPQGLTFPLRLFEHYETRDPAKAAVWAERVLDAHDRLRLDPTRQLSADDLRRARAATGR